MLFFGKVINFVEKHNAPHHLPGKPSATALGRKPQIAKTFRGASFPSACGCWATSFRSSVKLQASLRLRECSLDNICILRVDDRPCFRVSGKHEEKNTVACVNSCAFLISSNVKRYICLGKA